MVRWRMMLRFNKQSLKLLIVCEWVQLSRENIMNVLHVAQEKGNLLCSFAIIWVGRRTVKFH